MTFSVLNRSTFACWFVRAIKVAFTFFVTVPALVIALALFLNDFPSLEECAPNQAEQVTKGADMDLFSSSKAFTLTVKIALKPLLPPNTVFNTCKSKLTSEADFNTTLSHWLFSTYLIEALVIAIGFPLVILMRRRVRSKQDVAYGKHYVLFRSANKKKGSSHE